VPEPAGTPQGRSAALEGLVGKRPQVEGNRFVGMEGWIAMLGGGCSALPIVCELWASCAMASNGGAAAS
jgi:hypothetical protein